MNTTFALRVGGFIALAAAIGTAGVAQAGLATAPVGAVITVGSELGTMQLDSNLVGQVTSNKDGSFRWQGSMQNATMGWGLDWDLTIDQDPSIAGVSAFTNLLGATSVFTFNIASFSAVGAGLTTQNGASAITVLDTGTDGATMAALAGGSVYDAVINGVSQQTLFNDPFSLVAPASGVNVAGTSWGVNPGGPLAVGDLFGINHAFSLTAGDQATVNSSFFINLIPAPGSAALFGLAGLIAARRRR